MCRQDTGHRCQGPLLSAHRACRLRCGLARTGTMLDNASYRGRCRSGILPLQRMPCPSCDNRRPLGRAEPPAAQAATHGDGPLLIVAGAGTGKTATLVHRVAWLIAGGVDPGRILLLTFTRRAAAEMLRRAENLVRRLGRRRHDPRLGRHLPRHRHPAACTATERPSARRPTSPSTTGADSEDLMNVVRTDLNLAKTDKRFPKKGTCMAIYSRCVNAREKLEPVLREHFPWCKDWQEELKQLFDGYVDRKEAAGVLDYDDLLLYWHALLADRGHNSRQARVGVSASLQLGLVHRTCPALTLPLSQRERGPRRRRRRPQALRLHPHRRVPGHQHPSGRHPLRPFARGKGADRGGRRRPVDLRLPRRHGPQHPRLPQALPEARRSSPWSRTTAARSRSWKPRTR